MPDRRVKTLLREMEGKQQYEASLEDPLKSFCAEMRKSGVDILLTETEKAIRSTDSSEPPKILKDILFTDVPAVIAKPRNHDEAKAVIGACRRLKIPIVVRGSASSAFGMVLPWDGGVVMDTGDLSGVMSIDQEKLEVNVLAGTRWSDLALELKKHGLSTKTTPSSYFSTLAGWFVTGGCGINTLSFGEFHQYVKGIRIVLPDGSDKQLAPEDLMFKLMVGSEGQLGAITEMRIAVRKEPKQVKTYLFQTSNDADAVKLIVAALKSERKPVHIKLFDENHSKEVNEVSRIPNSPLHDAPAVLMQFEGDSPEDVSFSPPSDLGKIETPEFMGNLLWDDRYFPMRGRKRGPGMLGAEVVVPLQAIPNYLSRVRSMGKMFGVEISSEAHILSEKEALVLSFFLTDQRRFFMYTIHAVLSLVMTRIGTEMKGRPYAVGIWNQPFMSFVIPKDKLELQKKVNREIDPDDLFNPGKYLSKRAKLSGALAVFLKERMTLFALGWFLAAASLGGRISKRLFSPKDEPELGALDISMLACARCGACTTVCPAYQVTGRETVTGRGKLLMARDIKAGGGPSDDEMRELFLCMKCHACEEVCQTCLPLLSAYEELEDMVEARIGRPKELIENFVAEVESSPEYEKMLYEGTVSPDAGLRDGDTDAV